MKNNIVILMFVTMFGMLPTNYTHAARAFSVDPNNASSYSTITEALNAIRGINQYQPKYDSSSHKIMMVKGSATVQALGFTGLTDLVEPGDILTNDNIHLYEVKEVHPDSKTLGLNRPVDHFDEWAISTNYSILEQNIINVTRGAYYEDIVLTGVNIVTFRGAGKGRTVLHQAGDIGKMQNSPGYCPDMSETLTNGTVDFIKQPPQKGRVAFENLSVHSNTASAFINYGQPVGSTDFVFRSVYYDQQYGNDMIYILGTGNVEISDSELRGTGDGFTFQGLNSVHIKNITLHDRYIPCLNGWTPAGIRLFDVAKPSYIQNSKILVEGMYRDGEHGGILVSDSGVLPGGPSLTIDSVFLSTIHVSQQSKLMGVPRLKSATLR